MKDRRVAKRYATALFQFALEIGKMEEINRECLKLRGILADRDFKRFFLQPKISTERKRLFIQKSFADKVHPALYKLLTILFSKGRIGIADEVFDYYDLLTDRYRGIEEAHIITAVPVADEYVKRLIEKMRRFSEYSDLRVTTAVDPGIIGGVKVFLGRHTVLDGSIETKLEEMKGKLLVFRHY